ncbi:hypothetical protein [Streptomyces sp. 6N223]|uniref:hypothetical protein n=1 Tax=Streptomyces sp. 6N223 TaxID=3457412 RepID=UPI003FD16E9C
MDQLVPLMVITGCLLAALALLSWFAARVRRRGTARDAFQVITGVTDMMYQPSAQESHHEIQAQAERKSPFSTPGAGPWRPAAARDLRTPPGAGRRPRRRRWRPRR